jgi:hypothetical protein
MPPRETAVAAAKPAARSIVDWYLLGIVAQIVGFAAIGVLDVYSDNAPARGWAADVLFQLINLALAIARFTQGKNPPWASYAQNFRIATRVLRPLAHFESALAVFTSQGVGFSCVFYFAMSAYDLLLVGVGLSTLFDFSERAQYIAYAAFREMWVIFSVLRFIRYLGDPVAMASSAAELFATSGFIYTVVLGRDPVPTRALGGIIIFVASQKLAYMFGLWP